MVKKAGGKIYGASLTAAEKKAMNIEIQNQLADYSKKHELEVDATVLWILHEEFGFGEKRLKKFYDALAPEIEELVHRYSMDDSDKIWLCTHMLKGCGIDIEAWANKKGESNE